MKYGRRPVSYYRNDSLMGITADVVIVDDEDKIPQWTGLYGSDGEPIYRFPETIEFGFIGKSK